MNNTTLHLYFQNDDRTRAVNNPDNEENDRKVTEHFEHDNCPECGTASVPYENVPDQAFRFCPKCDHEWFENLDTWSNHASY